MTIRVKYVLSVVGAAALVGSVMTNALASVPVPVQKDAKPAAVKRYNYNGNVYISNVLRVGNNNSVYGHLYAHNGVQVWKAVLVHSGGLTVKAGGIKADALDVLGPVAAQQATISGNLQAGTLQSSGAITGSSLALTAGTGGSGTLTAAGKITGNGVDAGAGGVTTTGAVNAASLATSGNISATGSITAAAAAIQSLSVTGAVNFSGATIQGLNLSSVLNGGTLPKLTLGTSNSADTPLTLAANGQSVALGVNSNADVTVPRLTANLLSAGCSTTSSAPLTVCQNGKTASFGVDTNGAITATNLNVTGTLTTGSNFAIGGNEAVTGTLTVNGATGVVAQNLQAPNAASSSSPGPLSVGASTLTLNTPNANLHGDFSILDGGDLALSANATTLASHIQTGPDRDVAGSVGVTLSGTGGAATVNFVKAYASAPNVVVTPTSDPGTARYYVNSTATGFTIRVVGTSLSGSLGFYYHVMGT